MGVGRKRRFDESSEGLVPALCRTRNRSGTRQCPCIARIAEVGRRPSTPRNGRRGSSQTYGDPHHVNAAREKDVSHVSLAPSGSNGSRVATDDGRHSRSETHALFTKRAPERSRRPRGRSGGVSHTFSPGEATGVSETREVREYEGRQRLRTSSESRVEVRNRVVKRDSPQPRFSSKASGNSRSRWTFFLTSCGQPVGSGKESARPDVRANEHGAARLRRHAGNRREHGCSSRVN